MKVCLTILMAALSLSAQAGVRGFETILLCTNSDGLTTTVVGIARGDWGFDFQALVTVKNQSCERALVAWRPVKKVDLPGAALYATEDGKFKFTVAEAANKANLFMSREIVQPVDIKDFECTIDPTKNALWFDQVTYW